MYANFAIEYGTGYYQCFLIQHQFVTTFVFQFKTTRRSYGTKAT